MHWTKLNCPTPIFQRIFKDVRLPGVECVVTYDREEKRFTADLVNKDSVVVGFLAGNLFSSHSVEEHLRILTALARATLLAEKSPEELRELDEPLQPRKKTKRRRKKKAKKPSNR